MSEMSHTALFVKLNNLAYKGIESVTVFCKMRVNNYVELLHRMHQSQGSGLHCIIKRFELNLSHLSQDFTYLQDRFSANPTSILDFPAAVHLTVDQDRHFANFRYSCNQVRPGHLISGIVNTPYLLNILNTIPTQVKKINLDTLRVEFTNIVFDSPEEAVHAQGGSARAQNASLAKLHAHPIDRKISCITTVLHGFKQIRAGVKLSQSRDVTMKLGGLFI